MSQRDHSSTTQSSCEGRISDSQSTLSGRISDSQPTLSGRISDSQSTLSETKDIATATAKRKCDFLNGCPISSHVDVFDVFDQLLLAIAELPPYDRFSDWGDLEFWNAITDEVNEQNRYEKQHVGTIIKVVQAYYEYYCHDKKLPDLRSARLKVLVLSVFKSGNVTIEQLTGLMDAVQTGEKSVYVGESIEYECPLNMDKASQSPVCKKRKHEHEHVPVEDFDAAM